MKGLNALRQDFCTKIILPFCTVYHAARQIFNRSIQRRPAVIYYCETTRDVQQALRYAREHRLPVRVQSGGHNYEGFCTGSGVLVIDVSRMKAAAVDEQKGTLEIEGGVNNRELYQLLGRYGIPFPSGTCPTVAAAGLTMGGGWGHSARRFGLACDSLIQVELVTAQGEVLTANERVHQDLFWALRGGGGGNFGIVTRLTYQLAPPVGNVTYVEINFPQSTEETTIDFFEAWQRWLKLGDTRFTPNSRIFNSAADGRGIYLRGFYYGEPRQARASLRPFLQLEGAVASFQFVPFLQAAEIDASFYPQSEQFRFAGRFACRDFTREQIRRLLRLIRERAPGSTYASIALYALGGKAGEPAPEDTAFYYRNAGYIIGLETVWDEAQAKEENLRWLSLRAKQLASVTTGSYINFPYLETLDYMDAYYGRNAARLQQVKQKYDPKNVFCFAQSIRIQE